MKFLFSLFLCFGVIIGFSQADQLAQAEKAYESKDYKSAINLYEQLSLSQPNSAGLLYNLANAYYEEGELARAILNYEKALIYAPNNSDIIYNLAIANDKIENPISNINNFFLSKWYKSMYKSMQSGAFMLILIVLTFLLIALVYFALFKENVFVQKYQWVLAAILLLLIILCYQLLQNRLALEQGTHGVVMESTTLYSGADARSQSLQDVDAGIKAEVMDSIGDWYKLSLPDREQGWMEKKEVTIIK